MNESEVRKLFLIIENTYHGFSYDDMKVAIWLDLLRDVPFELAQRNLRKHIMTEKFPPTVAELSRKPEHDGPYIPGAEETRLMLEARDKEWSKAVPMPSGLKEKVKELVRKNA